MFKKDHEVKKDMTLSAGLDVLWGFFSASASYVSMQDTVMNKFRNILKVRLIFYIFKVHFDAFLAGNPLTSQILRLRNKNNPYNFF